MEQTTVNFGEYNENWKQWVLAWLVIVAGVALTTPLGFWTTLTGTAGLYLVYQGARAIGRSFSAKSVDRTTIGSLDGRREAVQVVGSAQPVGDPYTAPLTDTDCIAWQIQVEEYRPTTHAGPT